MRERKEDIPTLVRFFLKTLSERLNRKIEFVSAGILAILQEYNWPGNARELENIVERAMILSQGDSLQLPSGTIPARRTKEANTPLRRSLIEGETEHIRAVLQHTHGVIAGPQGAASILDVNPNTLRSRMRELGIEVDRSTYS